jgi:trehalose-6-phosphatase
MVDQVTQRSVMGYVFALGDNLDDSTAFTWSSKQQATISILSTEAEYVPPSVVTWEPVWIHQLLISPGTPKLDLR